MPRRAFRIAYDGRPYRGFQRQPDVTTVEDELFRALRRLDVLEGEKPPGYAAAGRTDAGVSALAQTVAFDAPDWLSPSALNTELPGPVDAWASVDAPPDFHATHDANWREYRYFLLVPDLDDQRARDALDRLTGEHDFHNLTPDDRNTVRELSGSLAREDDFLVLTLRAEGFCRELARRVVSLVEDVAAGGSFDRIEDLLGPDPVEGPDGVPPADPHPLVLHDVDYDLAFAVDEDAAAHARERFAALREDRLALAAVAGHVADGI
ncbi:tRNA pseudouridine(38-40) synthase TruA [Halobacterium wangiae]|uniref:tRNA pseudouridine(38-40) synthase TruA n=1 Tax=Halobacterium wangiae TaxID=2902623 RepID=UPI001E394989|nr:tRNA pseudouridine(38-40) synthase TruA [Halobacterium wangiae]